MSENFTYKSPQSDKFLNALLKLLEAEGETSLHELLRNSKCEIEPSSMYSEKRWDAFYTTIYFSIPTYYFDPKNFTTERKASLISYCDSIMPRKVGYDVMNVEISPIIETDFTDIPSMEDDLDDLFHSFGQKEEIFIPEDVMTKGKEMMKVYYYLYAIENFLRLFIESVCIKNYGNEYFTNIQLTRNITDTIKGRKKNEDKNRWVSIRGDSDLFYLDFIELKSLVENNWTDFKNYFPDQSWISSKLDELYYIRNLVAHNSYVGEHERNILQVNFRSIVNQLRMRN